jgi:hypothetical protein
MGFFDKVTGKEKKIRLINQKETENLKQKQKTAREELVFRHGGARSVLQGEFKQVRDKQQDERTLLAKRIYEFRQVQERERKNSISPTFDRAGHDKSQDRSGRGDLSQDSENTSRKRSSKRATRARERKPE